MFEEKQAHCPFTIQAGGADCRFEKTNETIGGVRTFVYLMVITRMTWTDFVKLGCEL